MKKLLATFIFLIAFTGFAEAQCNGVFPANTVCGKVGSPGIPGPLPNSTLTGVPGGSNGQIEYNNAGNFGGFTASGDATVNTGTGVVTIQPGVVTNAKLATGAANTVKGSINGTTTSDLALASCSAVYQFTQWVTGTGWQCGINAVIPSRATATGLNLSAFTSVTTLGYTTPGDGGGGVFVKSTPFIDTKVTAGSITANGTCTNGTYLGVAFSGGTGRGLIATVIVTGTHVTTVTITGVGGQGYSVNDLLTISSSAGGGTAQVTCTVAPTWTVSTITTPTGSFTDSASNKFQITYDTKGVDVRAFGFKADWTFAGGDGAATDNFTPLQNAINFASYNTASIPDQGGTKGGVALLPTMTGMFCGGGATSLLIPDGVALKGQGKFSSAIKPCDSFTSSVNIIELCDPTTHYSCFDAKLVDMQVYMSFAQDTGSSTTNVALIHTNNDQDTVILDNVKLYPGSCRRGIWLETGYGGTTYNTIRNIEIAGGKAAASCGSNANPLIFINYGTTMVKLVDIAGGGLAAGSGGPRDNGLLVSGGFVEINGYHLEQIVNPITIQIPTSLANGQVSAKNLIGGVSCIGAVLLTSTNTLANFLLEPPNALNGCTRMVTDGQPAGSNFTGPATTDIIFNP